MGKLNQDKNRSILEHRYLIAMQNVYPQTSKIVQNDPKSSIVISIRHLFMTLSAFGIPRYGPHQQTTKPKKNI